MNTDQSTYGAIVIGGGIAGLTTAAYLGRAGYRTLVMERSAKLGGRAVTRAKEGFLFNVGPHALYQKGEGCRVLADLGVTYTGGQPSGPSRWILDGNKIQPMPGSAGEILTAGFLSLRERLEILRVLARLPAYCRDEQWDHRPLSDWLDSKLRSPRSRQYLAMFIRLATYCGDPSQRASAALQQLSIALQGVLYLDGGWQTLVDGLASCATRHGVQVETSAAVTGIDADGSGAVVSTGDGRTFEAGVAIIAAGPHFAAQVVNDGRVPSLTRWAAEARPIHAACLDVALSSLPKPKDTFALGLQEPYYFSVHSTDAKLAPSGGAVIHLARYLGQNDPPNIEEELESILDRLQPGWHERIVTKRYLPRMAVAESTIEAGIDRPGPSVPELANVFVTGDWVGPEGMLVDAAFASARLAAELANHHLESASLASA